MDGRRRLAEPVTDGAPMRPAAGAAPVHRRARLLAHVLDRIGYYFGRTRLARPVRRWSWTVRTWRLPRGAGVAAVLALILSSLAFGAVRGGHLPVVMAELR